MPLPVLASIGSARHEAIVPAAVGAGCDVKARPAVEQPASMSSVSAAASSCFIGRPAFRD